MPSDVRPRSLLGAWSDFDDYYDDDPRCRLPKCDGYLEHREEEDIWVCSKCDLAQQET